VIDYDRQVDDDTEQLDRRHHWLRVGQRIRLVLETCWDAAAWSIMKAELGKALALKARMARACWWN
jgi:hypothetical protein